MDLVRNVLLDHWDPIDIKARPNWPKDEYDNYIPQVLSRLYNNGTEQEIVDLLISIETKEMEYIPDVKRAHMVAQTLKKLVLPPLKN